MLLGFSLNFWTKSKHKVDNNLYDGGNVRTEYKDIQATILSSMYLCAIEKNDALRDYSHCHVVRGGCGAGRSLQEVVELGLQLPELDVPPVGAVVDGLAQQAHPRVGQATGGAVVAVAPAAAAAARAAATRGATRSLVIQLEAAKAGETNGLTTI